MLALAGCGGDGGGTDGGRLSVYLSLPLSGGRAAEGRAAAGGAGRALRRNGGEAGGHMVRVVVLDDTGGSARWTLASAGANARAAAQDSAAIAFIGDLDSGATRASLPITNQAGLVQIAPAPTARDLTHRVSERLTPERYRPSGDQTFLRLYPVGGDLEPCSGFAGTVQFEGGDEAALGYEAMSVVLDAIGEAGADREEVREAILEGGQRRGPFGAYAIDPSGDVSTAGGCP